MDFKKCILKNKSQVLTGILINSLINAVRLQIKFDP